MCGAPAPASGIRSCVLPKGHDGKYASGPGSEWSDLDTELANSLVPPDQAINLAASEREWALARILHESGRQAVEEGAVLNRPSGSPGQPFVEWDRLPPRAKLGRILMARYLIEHEDELRDALRPR